MKIKDIYSFLKKLYPLDSACGFDNVGLLIGDENGDTESVLISLDCTKATVSSAIEKGCRLIITHHPVIFDGLKSIPADSAVYSLIKNGISVISMHTNLDMGKDGINDCLCRRLGLENTEPFTAEDGYILKLGEHTAISADDFAEEIRTCLGGIVKYSDGGRLIKSVAVCSGAGGDFIADTVKSGVDALVTADVKHHQFIFARDNGVSLFDAGHFDTEDIIAEPLRELLQKQFPNILFIADHNSYIKYSV